MQRHAFKMFLNPGCANEYRRRHDAIRPELSAFLKQAGIANYSIHLDPETNVLFAYLERRADHRMDDLPRHEIMRRWWDHMKDHGRQSGRFARLGAARRDVSPALRA